MHQWVHCKLLNATSAHFYLFQFAKKKKKKKANNYEQKNLGLSSWCKLDDELLMVLSLHLGPQQDASPIQQLIPVAIERRGGCGLARNKNVALSTNSKVYRGKLYIISPIVSHLL